MKMKGIAKEQAAPTPPPSFDVVAALISPAQPPPVWLKQYLVSWAPSVRLDQGVHGIQPTKAKMKKQLLEVSRAAHLLNSGLTDTATREFLERVGGIEFRTLGALQHALKNIGERAKVAADSSALSTSTGETKRGRRRALTPGAYEPKTFCAVVIAEAWKFVREAYPAPRNWDAASAAHAYWLASGGRATNWGDPLSAWSPHFRKAQGPGPAKEREECLRHLTLGKQASERDGI
jgi:hypothetical protein